MKVIKIGGGCLKGEETIAEILELIAERGHGHIFVLSALSGITNLLIDGMSRALEDEEQIPLLIQEIREQHLLVARHLVCGDENLKGFTHDFSASLKKLERLYYGLNFTGEVTPRLWDSIVSFGERFSVELISYALHCRGIQAEYRMPKEIGLLTDGKFGDATANLAKTAKIFQEKLLPLLDPEKMLFLPGFFGVSEQGDITTFGRGGSDYAAAVVAAATQAECLEIWKDTDGFMSADPKLVPDAKLIPLLSYEEAAELAYFGAKILHPRTMEPVRKAKISIAIKNTLNPDAEGSLIAGKSPKTRSVVKSVAHNGEIGVMKIHASGVGARPGILGCVADCLAEHGLNIKSAITSQTCISLLLDAKDLDAGQRALQKMKPRPYQRLEVLDDVAMLGVVGEGLLQHTGLAATCFTAVAGRGINVEMISFGPSRAALYFLVRQKNLHEAAQAIHHSFFH